MGGGGGGGGVRKDLVLVDRQSKNKAESKKSFENTYFYVTVSMREQTSNVFTSIDKIKRPYNCIQKNMSDMKSYVNIDKQLEHYHQGSKHSLRTDVPSPVCGWPCGTWDFAALWPQRNIQALGIWRCPQCEWDDALSADSYVQ